MPTDKAFGHRGYKPWTGIQMSRSWDAALTALENADTPLVYADLCIQMAAAGPILRATANAQLKQACAAGAIKIVGKFEKRSKKDTRRVSLMHDQPENPWLIRPAEFAYPCKICGLRSATLYRRLSDGQIGALCDEHGADGVTRGHVERCL